jgi:hypothetical protein
VPLPPLICMGHRFSHEEQGEKCALSLDKRQLHLGGSFGIFGEEARHAYEPTDIGAHLFKRIEPKVHSTKNNPAITSVQVAKPTMSSRTGALPCKPKPSWIFPRHFWTIAPRGKSAKLIPRARSAQSPA